MAENVEVEYLLKMVYVRTDEKGRRRHCLCKCEHELCQIGTFKNEEELEQWARENRGELAKS